MNSRDLIQSIRIEEKHVSWYRAEVPQVDPGLYNTLGRQLFDLYQKYSVSSEDQRQIEKLSWILQSFNLAAAARKPWWRRWL